MKNQTKVVKNGYWVAKYWVQICYQVKRSDINETVLNMSKSNWSNPDTLMQEKCDHDYDLFKCKQRKTIVIEVWKCNKCNLKTIIVK